MTIIEPDVFYSDIVLGLVIFGVAYALYTSRHQTASAFLCLGSSTWIGGFYHGLYDTTTIAAGWVLWTLTMLVYGLSSFLFIRYAIRGWLKDYWLYATGLLYALYIILIDSTFLYGLSLQGLAIVSLGVHLLITKASKQKILYFGVFLVVSAAAIYVQQAKVTLGLPYSHNTLFHIIEIPAVILLYLSLRK